MIKCKTFNTTFKSRSFCERRATEMGSLLCKECLDVKEDKRKIKMCGDKGRETQRRKYRTRLKNIIQKQKKTSSYIYKYQKDELGQVKEK